jgi:heptosyltransferase III
MPGSGKNISRILLVRNDRIGDLVLTTPAVSALRRHLPEAQIDLLCASYAEPVVRANPHLSEVLTDRGAHDSSDLQELADSLRGRSYDCAVVFVSSFKNARLVRKAGIPLRIGPRARLYAPLYFNKTLRQRRSLAEKNEAHYNIDLLAPLGVSPDNPPPPMVIPTAGAVHRAESLLARELGPRRELPLVLVHPGMGGSALNWPEERWRELIGRLAADGRFTVLVSGSEAERDLVERLTAGLEEDAPVRRLTGLSLEDFIGVLSRTAAAVAPSTGPLHLAAALGVPAAGIYSPVRVHHPRRWGPLGAGCRTFLPHVECPGALRCLEGRCPHHPCMGRIGTVEVLEFIRALFG